jgi:hypothetical protein
VRCPWLVIVSTPLGATALLKLRLPALRRKPSADRNGGRARLDQDEEPPVRRYEMEREGARKVKPERQFV